MISERHNTVPDSSTVPATTGSACENGTCRTVICSPCLIVWGLMVIWLITIALWERFQ